MSYVDIKKIDKFLGTKVLAAIIQTSIDGIVPLAVANSMGKIQYRGGITPSANRQWKQYFVEAVVATEDIDRIHDKVSLRSFTDELLQMSTLTTRDLVNSWFFTDGHERGTELSHYCDEECSDPCSLKENAVEIPYENNLPMDGIFSLPNLTIAKHLLAPQYDDFLGYVPYVNRSPTYVGITEKRIFDLIKRSTPKNKYADANTLGASLSQLGWDTITCGDMELTHMSHCPEGQMVVYKKDKLSLVVNDGDKKLWRWTGLNQILNQIAGRNIMCGQFLTMANWVFEDPNSCFVITDIPRHP